MKKVDLNLIQMKSKPEINQELVLGEDYTFKIKVGIVQKITSDNQDGSVNVVYVFKPYEVEIIND